MYSKELEELIDASIADGVITDQEQAVLIRRAQQEGVDPNELAVVVNGRLEKIRLQKTEAKEKKRADSQVGAVLKCSHCGAQVTRMMGKCPECGHVFTNVKAGKTVSQLSEKMSSKSGFLLKVMDSLMESKSDYIKNLAVPNSKEELMDVMLFLKNQPEVEFDDSYKNKLTECIERCRLLFPEDREVMRLVADCESKLKKAKKKGRVSAFIGGLFAILIFCGLGVGIYFGIQYDNKQKAKVEEQLKSLIAQIDALPTPSEENVAEVSHQISQIVWLPIDSEDNILKPVIQSFLSKKNGYIHSINALGLNDPIPDDELSNYLKPSTPRQVAEEAEGKSPVADKEKSVVAKEVDAQYATLHEQLETLPEVDVDNYEEVAAELAGLLWKPITDEAETAKKTFKSPSDDEKYERKIKKQWFGEVKAMAKKMKAFYRKNAVSLVDVDNADIEALAKNGYLE